MSLPLIPSYLVILNTLDSTELANHFKQFLVILSMSGTSISWLQIAASILCAREQTQEYVLASLWDGSCHISFVHINSFVEKIVSRNIINENIYKKFRKILLFI